MVTSNNSALLLVDIQNDFCTGGSLAVPGSGEIMPVVNAAITDAQDKRWPIIASRDWHPVDHCSFNHRGGPWPVHCVQDTHGAAFHPEMDLPATAIRVSKGTAFETDAYSAFDGTQLEQFLSRRGIKHLQVMGLALDVCVRATVQDALKLGFDVELLAAGTRAVDADQADDVLNQLEEAGATVLR
ncbi:isochorismatase family protein [Marinobacter halodurans]|uniref:nicotinamidase n=1 Tax=Marinobacter halodurans TaxID=2528979 RepID=A0ABY1ZJR2_9GAMM|nr:isochorismatase family protein [Marinobacter halodurans]TBW55198.1 isochorismatase family protein [Marinobacter halodurans]